MNNPYAYPKRYPGSDNWQIWWIRDIAANRLLEKDLFAYDEDYSKLEYYAFRNAIAVNLFLDPMNISVANRHVGINLCMKIK